MRFATPLAFLLVAPVLVELWWRWPTRGRAPRTRIGFPALPFLGDGPAQGRARWMWIPRILWTAGLLLLVCALARPQSPGDIRDAHLRGRNIMLVLDISSSMKAPDFKTGDRLTVAKRTLERFIPSRAHDFIGLVVFAGQAFRQAPLTTDADAVLGLLARADIGLLPDGTAIGTALALAESQLADRPKGTGVIVLITDGGNNAGVPDPLTSAAAARALGIRVYTIGVSAAAGATPPPPAAGQRPATMEAPSVLTTREEALLRRIASTTGGRYYRATEDTVLVSAMADIDRVERSELHLTEVVNYREHYALALVPALLCLTLALALQATWLRTLP
jgi:Ca-activated chloride channel family protein